MIAVPARRRTARRVATLSLLFVAALASSGRQPAAAQETERTTRRARQVAALIETARLFGLDFTEAEAKQARGRVQRNAAGYRKLRAVPLANGVAPAFAFAVHEPRRADDRTNATRTASIPITLDANAARPDDLEQLAFAPIRTLAALIRAKRVSVVELTEMYLRRLKRVNRTLNCVVSFTEAHALARAKALDGELAAGKWRGPLHGIPYGAKDLFSAPGYRTTWGAKPFEQQAFEDTAHVIRKLDEAGGVLIAKLSLGALAMGDVWFGGRTRTPWNPERGSSGSSAGSAAATAAGAVAFALGTETLGSIISPSNACGCSSLRPTFGRVGRGGAMALSWTMDKVGPICRSLDDAALVFRAVHGPDPRDRCAVDRPFAWPIEGGVAKRRVGILPALAEKSEHYAGVIGELKKLDVELVSIELPDAPLREMLIILHVEAAAAFDELTRSGRDDELTRQQAGAWPNSFRVARFVPAVEYVQANRIRTKVMRDMAQVMKQVDCYVHPTFGGKTLLLTNLTGHPTVIAPAGPPGDGRAPPSICFTGRVFDEATLLHIASAWQRATGYHDAHPEMPAKAVSDPPKK